MKYASLSTAVLSSVGAIVVGLTATAGGAHAQIFQDNSLGYRYGTQFKEPGVTSNDITKSIVNFTHVDADKWGGDFFSLDILFSASSCAVNCKTWVLSCAFSPLSRVFSAVDALNCDVSSAICALSCAFCPLS